MAKADTAAKTDLLAATSAEVAVLFGASPQTVANWRGKIDVAVGIWWDIGDEKGARGGGGGKAIRWDLPRLRKWRAEQEVAEALERVKPRTAPAMSDLELEQLRKIRLHNDETDRRLVNRAELDRQWAKAGGELRQRLELLGRRHGPTVANDLARAMKDVERTIHGLMGKAP